MDVGPLISAESGDPVLAAGRLDTLLKSANCRYSHSMLVEHRSEKLSRAGRTSQIENNRSGVGFNREREAKKPAALTFRIYGPPDERQHITLRGKPETIAVRQFVSFLGTIP
jgi:hypothetical protein